MSLCNANDIRSFIQDSIIENAQLAAVNATSLDIHLGDLVLREQQPLSSKETGFNRVISLRDREALTMQEVRLSKTGGIILHPGEFILAQSVEVFNLPNWLSAEYKLKSSMARIGLEHLNAGWCDAGWHGSVLTLELKNMSQYHDIELLAGDRIGQLVFFAHEAVSADHSYANKGSYNKLAETSAPIAAKGDK